MSETMTHEDELDLIRRKAEIEALVSEREGMIAFNQERINQGHTPGYDDKDFFSIAEQLREIQSAQWKPQHGAHKHVAETTVTEQSIEGGSDENTRSD